MTKDLTPARVADFNRRYDASHPPAVAPPSSRSAGLTRREWAQIVVAPLLILVMFVVAVAVAK